VTYSRLPAVELYRVTGSGLEGGLSRALVFANFPAALVAIPVALLAAERIATRWAWIAAAAAVALSAVVAWPGVVNQNDLDARPVNGVPAAGVALAIGLTLVAAARVGTSFAPRQPADRSRLAAAIFLFLFGLPWIAADLGFSFDGVPVLGSIWQTGELRHQPGLPGLHPALHHGHHHGMDGILVAVSALVLSRTPSRTRPGLISAYLALLFAYGVGNIANDFWLEQVAKRGWTSWLIPSVLNPTVSWAWAVIVGGGVLAWALLFRPRPTARP
jgi:hypothetical protein